MQQSGVRFQPSLTGTLSLGRTNAFFLGGGKALVNAYYLTAERLGVDILYDSEVLSLSMDDGTVRRAEITYRGFPATVNARCVVVASGGFQANLDWMREYWGDAVDNFVIRGTPYNRGRVLRNLLDQGVAPVGDPTQCHAVALDARAPKFDGGITTRLDSVPFSIVVNRDGERFYDEGEDVWPKRYAIWGRLIAQQPGQIAYSILDAKAVTLFMPSVYPAIRADTLGELAERLGLDPVKLQATVARLQRRGPRRRASTTPSWTAARTEGLTPPKTHWARTIDTPPFIGYPLRPGITFTYLGVRVNERAQVLMEDGRPAANLFASGEIMAGNILGKGYLAGFGMTIGTVFGRIAGAGGGDACAKLRRSREARRVMEICNACRYCEGFCAVFPAMTLKREFADGDLALSRQSLPQLPRLLLRLPVRAAARMGRQRAARPSPSSARESYEEYAWPRRFAALFQRNGVVVSLVIALGIALVLHPDHAGQSARQPDRGAARRARRVLRRHPALGDAGRGHRQFRLCAGRARHGRRAISGAMPARRRAGVIALAIALVGRADAAQPGRRRQRLQRQQRALLDDAALAASRAVLRLPALLRRHLRRLRTTTPSWAGRRHIHFFSAPVAAGHGRRRAPADRHSRACSRCAWSAMPRSARACCSAPMSPC